MNVIYKHYEPDQGFEEHQAKIYTEASGLPTTADEIRTRLNSQNRDPKAIRYALTDKGEPLAYVQAIRSSSNPGRVYVSYPWAIPGCPAEVQEKLFDEVVSYVQEHEKPLEIASSFVLRSKIADKQIQFYQKKGFVEKERIYWYYSDFDVNEVSKQEITEELNRFIARLATNADIDKLIDICRVDPHMRRVFPTREASVNYFRDRVLKDGHAVLLFENNVVVAAGAPLRIKPNHPVYDWKEERIIMRFTAIRPGYSAAMKRLLIEVARECLSAGWSEIPFRLHFYFHTGFTAASFLAEMEGNIQTFEAIFVHQSNHGSNSLS
ncbi:MAG: hypothetical protein JSW11_01500 [Candidatus Heimdallarchaeota archaeon]|nr:MAG: hypothetical protein JSW11_01500 [Candidatus Heimdallarchaeota archaeon]